MKLCWYCGEAYLVDLLAKGYVLDAIPHSKVIDTMRAGAVTSCTLPRKNQKLVNDKLRKPEDELTSATSRFYPTVQLPLIR